MSKTSCFGPRILAAMSWLARSMLRTKGFGGSEEMGTGMRPSPTHPTGDYGTSDGAGPPSSRIAERHGHELGRIAHLHAHQNGVLALGLGLFERVAHVANVSDRLAADVQNDVTSLKTLVGGRPIRFDIHDHNALVACTDNIARGS